MTKIVGDELPVYGGTSFMEWCIHWKAVEAKLERNGCKTFMGSEKTFHPDKKPSLPRAPRYVRTVTDADGNAVEVEAQMPYQEVMQRHAAQMKIDDSHRRLNERHEIALSILNESLPLSLQNAISKIPQLHQRVNLLRSESMVSAGMNAKTDWLRAFTDLKTKSKSVKDLDVFFDLLTELNDQYDLIEGTTEAAIANKIIQTCLKLKSNLPAKDEAFTPLITKLMERDLIKNFPTYEHLITTVKDSFLLYRRARNEGNTDESTVTPKGNTQAVRVRDRCKLHPRGTHTQAECRQRESTDKQPSNRRLAMNTTQSRKVNKPERKPYDRNTGSKSCANCNMDNHQTWQCRKLPLCNKCNLRGHQTEACPVGAAGSQSAHNTKSVFDRLGPALELLGDQLKKSQKPATPTKTTEVADAVKLLASKLSGFITHVDAEVLPEHHADEPALDEGDIIEQLLATKEDDNSHSAQKVTDQKFLDSACSKTMTPFKDNFIDFRPVNYGTVTVANEQRIPIKGIGTYKFQVNDEKFILMDNVLYVPDLASTLISVNDLVSEDDYAVIFTSKSCHLYHYKNKDMQTIGTKEDRLYHHNPTNSSSVPTDGPAVANATDDLMDFSWLDDEYDYEAPDANEASVKHNAFNTKTKTNLDTVKLWHGRLGHINYPYLSKMLALNLVSGIDLHASQNNKINNPQNKNSTSTANESANATSAKLQCIVCDAGKMRKKHIPHTAHPNRQVNEQWNTDLHGPISTLSYHRYKYFQIMIEYNSRFLIGFFLKRKSEASSFMKTVVETSEAEKNRPVLKIQADNGELKSNEFDNWCSKREPPINIIWTPPYTHEMNGPAERPLQSIAGISRCLLFHARLPPKMWEFSYAHAVYLKNRTYHAYHHKTPYEVWYGTKPDLSHLRIFGCLTIMWVTNEKHRPKLAYRGRPGILLGFVSDRIAIVFSFDKQQIEHHAHYRCYETRFPGLSTLSLRDLLEAENPEIDPITLAQIYADHDIHDPLYPSLDSRGGRKVIRQTDDDPDSHPHTHTLSNGETDSDRDTQPTSPLIRTNNQNTLEKLFDDMSDSDNDSGSSTETEIKNQEMKKRSKHPKDVGEWDQNPKAPSKRQKFIPIDEHATDDLSLKANMDAVKAFKDQFGDASFISFKNAVNTNEIMSQTSMEATTMKNIELNKIMDLSLRAYKAGENLKVKNKDGKLHVSDLPPVPRSFDEAMKSKFAPEWRKAMDAEMNSHAEHKTWKLVDKPENRQIVNSHWIYDYKLDSDGYLDKFKARTVAGGDTQTKDIDYKETFSPVVRIQSLRLMVALSLIFNLVVEQMDVSTAFLYGKLTETNYMRQPKGYVKRNEQGIPLVCELLQSIYGLHQAARDWNITLDEFLIENGFTRATADPCVYYKIDRYNNEFKVVIVYVDDLMLFGLTIDSVNQVKDAFKNRFKMKELGAPKWLLGIQMERRPNAIWLGQPRYAREILEGANMWNFRQGEHDLPVTSKPTPMVINWQHNEASEPLSKEEHAAYRSTLMKLSYLCQQTRPDMIYAVNVLAQYQQQPNKDDWKALLRVLRYLRGTWDHGIEYQRTARPLTVFLNDDLLLADESIRPIGHADASYANESKRRSRSGYVFLVAGAAISWMTKVQPTVALSSTESEYYALGESVKEALWIRHLLTELSFATNNPTVIHQDNKSTIAIAYNPIHHQRIKHIDIRAHFLRQHLSDKKIELTYCPTEDMIADVLTKPLPQAQHHRLSRLMGMTSLTDFNLKHKPELS